jgi:hypothetical protein
MAIEALIFNPEAEKERKNTQAVKQQQKITIANDFL